MRAEEGTLRRESPSSAAEAAELMRASGAEGLRMRPVGAGTKLAWGRPAPDPDLELCTRNMGRVIEHSEGDLTAVLEPGVPLARAQEAFGEAGQMLSLDPPLGGEAVATIGGVVATADSGPLRHRYGVARDLVVGMTVALSDGTIAKAGGRVIKNVAGYDLAKLFAGSYGTLGLIVQVTVRLHPRPERTASVAGGSDDPDALARAARALGHSHLEMLSLDARWEGGRGALMARFGGGEAESQARAGLRLVEEAGLEPERVTDDDELWQRQRAGQRARPEAGTVVRVGGTQTELPIVLRAAERLDAEVVGRAALGVSWVKLADDLSEDDTLAAIAELRRELAPAPCVVLDAPATVRARIDPWGEDEGPRLELMRRVKERFDPPRVCNPGVFVGDI